MIFRITEFSTDNDKRKCELIINFPVPPCWLTSGQIQWRKHAARKVYHRWERQKPTQSKDLPVICDSKPWCVWLINEPKTDKPTSSRRREGWFHKGLTEYRFKESKDGSVSQALAVQKGEEYSLNGLPPTSLTPGSAWLLASQRPEEMVLFPNTNYFLPPTTCSVGAPLSLPDSSTAQPPWAESRTSWQFSNLKTLC